MTHEVRFTREAAACIRDIRDWLAERSPNGALRWLDALESACGRVAEGPDSFALAPESDEFGEPLRQILFKTRRGRTYRALFIVRERIVHVVSVRGAGQAPIDPSHVEIPD
jgi:plasmid stabilization system protein ParE